MADIIGTPGDESLAGTSADNSISGLGGNDVIDGGSGLDTADFDDPVTTANLTPITDSDPNAPGDQPGWTVSTTPTLSSNEHP